MRKELFDREELYTSEDHVRELVIMICLSCLTCYAIYLSPFFCSCIIEGQAS